jgi:mycofactocin precursor
MSESSVQVGSGGVAVLEEAFLEVATPEDDRRDDDAVLAEFLVEEVSIDGMCGVY